ncbi:MAG: hypothetical protein N4A44_03715 [Alphaproteobacteria bacterium]|jgi:hypothetical protein|nr:hypothetical protein [Alphaproteobacteria bacterium]
MNVEEFKKNLYYDLSKQHICYIDLERSLKVNLIHLKTSNLYNLFNHFVVGNDREELFDLIEVQLVKEKFFSIVYPIVDCGKLSHFTKIFELSENSLKHIKTFEKPLYFISDNECAFEGTDSKNECEFIELFSYDEKFDIDMFDDSKKTRIDNITISIYISSKK